MEGSIKDNSTTMILCGFRGNYCISKVAMHTLHLEMIVKVIRSLFSASTKGNYRLI